MVLCGRCGDTRRLLEVDRLLAATGQPTQALSDGSASAKWARVLLREDAASESETLACALANHARPQDSDRRPCRTCVSSRRGRLLLFHAGAGPPYRGTPSSAAAAAAAATSDQAKGEPFSPRRVVFDSAHTAVCRDRPRLRDTGACSKQPWYATTCPLATVRHVPAPYRCVCGASTRPTTE